MKNINNGLRILQGIWITGLLFVLSTGLFLIPQRAKAALPFPTLTVINVPDSIQTTSFGINKDGEIVGFFEGSDEGTHGFLLDKKGNFTTIDVPGISLSFRGINPSGNKIVGFFQDCDEARHGFLLTFPQ